MTKNKNNQKYSTKVDNGTNQDRKKGKNFQPRELKFTGDCDDLHGMGFDVSGFIQTKKYIKTLKKITRYIGRNYQDSRDILRALEELEDVKYDNRNEDWPAEPTVDKNGLMSPTAKEI